MATTTKGDRMTIVDVTFRIEVATDRGDVGDVSNLVAENLEPLKAKALGLRIIAMQVVGEDEHGISYADDDDEEFSQDDDELAQN
jgi:hypothetical protein